MTDRERLIELIDSCRYWGSNTSAEIADRLIANGVTVQQWIPATDGLPNVNKTKRGYESVGVIVRVDGYKNSGYRIYERATNRGETVYRWKYPWDRISDENITHWMPLPEPPPHEVE